MVKLGKLIEDLAERFDVPGDAAANLPRLTLTGSRRLLIENHRGLLEYTNDLIEVAGGRLRIRVRGEELLLRTMDSEALIITGNVMEVELE